MAYDLVIKGGFVVDGTGAARYRADVAIADGRIVEIGRPIGVGVAPCKPADREVTAADLTNLEAIPKEVLQAGLTWDWDSFPSCMGAAARRGSAINLGFLAPLNPFRHWVMGRDSLERAATPAETERIAAALRDALIAGAVGISTSVNSMDIGYEGKPLACRMASRDELKAYCHVLRDLGKGVIQLNLALGTRGRCAVAGARGETHHV